MEEHPFDINKQKTTESCHKIQTNDIKGQLRKNPQDLLENPVNRCHVIPKADMDKMFQVLSEKQFEGPVYLQLKVFVDLVYYMCRRGCEGLRNLTKKSFHVKKAADGRRYVVEADFQRKQKTCGNGLKYSTNTNIMLEQQNVKYCPVRTFERYCTLLHPDQDSFFQRSNHLFSPIGQKNNRYYDNYGVGMNTISGFMPTISEMCGLSEIFTNHRLPATTIETLMISGKFDRHQVSQYFNHTNIECECLNIYLEKPTIEDKQAFNVVLEDYVQKPNKRIYLS